MRRQLQGIGIILLSILFTISCHINGWTWGEMFMTQFEWSHIFMVTGVIGFLLIFLPEKHK